MQPEPPPDPSVPHRPPAAGWPPTSGQRPPEGAVAAATPGPGGPAARRSRPGLVAIVALLVEIAVIGGAANQVVARRVSEAIFDDSTTASFDWGRSLLTYQWRFTPLATDTFHVLYGQFALIGATLVGTVVLVLAAARGGAGFWRVFLATWAAVIASTAVGAVARGLVVDPAGVGEGDKSKLRFALFGTFSASQFVFVAALVLGLVVALAAGLAAALTGRPPEPVGYAPPPAYAPPSNAPPSNAPASNAPAPGYAPPPAAGAQPQGAMPPPPDATQEFRRPEDSHATQQFGPPPDADRTQQFARTDADVPPSDPAPAAEPTQQYPALGEQPLASSAPKEPPAQDVPDDPDTTRR